MNYLIHRCEPCVFVGTTADQVINTVKYYHDERGYTGMVPPEKESLVKASKLELACCLPFANSDHTIVARPAVGVSVHVNANAFEYIQRLARDYGALKRGDLYKFSSPAIGLIHFLPPQTMESLRDYDWEQHRQQVTVWLKERRKVISGLTREGVLMPDDVIIPVAPVIGVDSSNDEIN